jgi:hypothetical protein
MRRMRTTTRTATVTMRKCLIRDFSLSRFGSSRLFQERQRRDEISQYWRWLAALVSFVFCCLCFYFLSFLSCLPFSALFFLAFHHLTRSRFCRVSRSYFLECESTRKIAVCCHRICTRKCDTKTFGKNHHNAQNLTRSPHSFVLYFQDFSGTRNQPRR